MSDPMTTRDTTQAPPPPPNETPPGKRSNPLIWILLVIVVLLLAWYWFVGRDQTDVMPDESGTPVAETVIGDDAAAEKSDRKQPATIEEPANTTTLPGDRAATPIARLQPEYPREAFRDREEGTVLLLAHVGSNGTTTSVEVTQSSGSRDLDRAATEAVSKWRFEPALENGQAVESAVQVPITFELDDQ